MTTIPTMMELDQWLALPTQDLATWVRQHGGAFSVGLPLDGTRRWYTVYRHDHPDAADYLTTLIERQVAIQRMVFDHGIELLLAPCYSVAILDRGETYARYALHGILQMIETPSFQDLLRTGVRVRFYGDLARLDTPAYRNILTACQDLQRLTDNSSGPLLLLGFFGDQPYEQIAQLSVAFYEQNHRIPSRHELIQAYYGIPVPEMGIFISFNKIRVFGVPLVETGRESVYTTLYPTPDLGVQQFREILFDHLISRRVSEVEYEDLTDDGVTAIRTMLQQRQGVTLGVGMVDPATGKWQAMLRTS